VRPVELYKFTQGGDTYTYTSADRDITYLAEDYIATAIGRNGIELKSDVSKANIEVYLPLGHTQAAIWMTAQSELSVGLTIFQQNDLGTNVIWKGRMAGMKPRKADIAFGFESLFTSLRRPGLRARFQRTCRHPLYQGKCKLDKADFAEIESATAISANGLVVTIPAVAALPGEYFTGMLEYNGVLRWITLQSGSTVTLNRAIPELTIASFPEDVTLYPGCDRSRERCHTRFANRDNYGGFNWIPINNPFGGSSIV
jgi:uncharacterized phage protein (TIGR02218 family)